MLRRVLYHDVPNCTGVLSIKVSESYNAACVQAQIECSSTSLTLGDSIDFDLGFVGSHGKAFEGYVRRIETNLPQMNTIITCEDVLSRAVDYFIAADNPEDPYKKFNISTEDLVEDLLSLCGITSFTSDVPLDVVWGTTSAGVELNLTTVWQALQMVTGALAWHIYADRDGTVHLTDDHPYKESGDTSSYTWTRANNDLLMASYEITTDDLRNRVVVYGLNNIHATESASSSYLPAGFYKTAVIATQIIDSQSVANQTASLNLARFNRPTESVQIQIEGDYRVRPREFCTVVESYTGLSGDWFIFATEHSMTRQGYITNLTLTR